MKNLYAIVFFLLLHCGLHAQTTCAANESTVVVSITTDNYGGETRWTLIDNNTNLTYGSVSNGSYPDGIVATYHDTICLPKSACVAFSIYDSYSDGICCAQGDGSYEVTLDGTLVASGGNFESQESTSFNCSPSITCETAIPVTEGNYTTATANYWYTFTPPQAGIYNITTCDLNSCNTKIWIYDNCLIDTSEESNVGTINYNDDNMECDNAAFLEFPFDPNLTYYIRMGDAANDCEGQNINWSLSYVGPVIGCTDPIACNYNPLAQVTDSLCFYAGNLENCPGPDLVLLEDKLRNTLYLSEVDNTDGCAISEGCLQGYGDREVIRFTTHIKNIGEVDYFIGSPYTDSTASQFTYDNCHNHNHYDGYAEYILFDEAGTALPIGFKNGFCVIDLECSGGGTFQYNCNYMGITAGCGDIYGSELDCQWIDITDTPDGKYTFVARVNWDNAPDALGRYETEFSNNWAQVCLNIYTTADSTRFVEKLTDCEPYVDCAGEIYGSAQPDCEGICNGSIVTGDINASGTQEMQDAYDYVTRILGNDITPTACNDLNADGNITVFDAALLSSCLNLGTSHDHPQTGLHDHCNFPQGISNPYDTVELSINDINYAEKYIDIDISNPDNGVVAYQFEMSGIEIMSVENLVYPVMYPIIPQTATGGSTVIGISYLDSLILKNFAPVPLCRIHYTNITDDEICIASITEVINQDYEQTVAKIGGDCIQVVGISNPLTTIKATISPNPMDKTATLTFPNTGNESFTLKITDVTGRVIQVHENIRDTEYTIQRGDMKSGVYLFHLESDEKISTGKLIVR